MGETGSPEKLRRATGSSFWKLLAVCIKMLFKKTTRKRFICLVALFLATMVFNTSSYIRRFGDTQLRKSQLLEENAFKVFFLRMRTKNDLFQFFENHRRDLAAWGVYPVRRAFIYQNNLFVHFTSPVESDPLPDRMESDALMLIYRLFGLDRPTLAYGGDKAPDPYAVRIMNRYIDHNGSGLSGEILANRHLALRGDLVDAADMLRGNLSGQRLAVFNEMTRLVIDTLIRQPSDGRRPTNRYVSRVDLVVPLNLLHLFQNLADDNATDIIDFSASVRTAEKGVLEVQKAYLAVPESAATAFMYGDTDLYPRYVPLYAPGLVDSRLNWMLFEEIHLNDPFMDFIEQRHLNGQYMFSFEKAYIARDRAKSINREIRSNHIHFYLTDVSMSVVFPFMISLFSFIHLKSEFAFLLMFKNRVRELMAVFWLIPLLMLLLVKSGTVAVHMMSTASAAAVTAEIWKMIMPMALSFLAAAAIFYPVNRWCFCPFIGPRIHLAALHKGR